MCACAIVRRFCVRSRLVAECAWMMGLDVCLFECVNFHVCIGVYIY